MTCPVCGSPTNPEMIYCTGCGANLRQQQATLPPPPQQYAPPPQQYAPPPQQYAPPPQQYAPQQYSPPPQQWAPPPGGYPPPVPYRGEQGLEWKWVGIGAATIVGLQFAVGMVVGRIANDGNADTLVWVLIGAVLASYFAGGLIVGRMSPGVTIKEAAIAGVVAVGINLIISIGQGGGQSIFAFVIGYALALGGGHVGERLQDAAEGRRR